MDKVKIVAGVVAGFLLVGCNSNPKFSEELKTVDSLQVVVENYLEKMDSVNTELMLQRADEVDQQYTFIEQNFTDTTQRDFWINKMSFYRLVMKGYTKFAKGEEELREEINKMETQLATLENSIKDEKLTEEEVDKYLQDEILALQQLQLHFNSLVPGLKRVNAMYDDLKPSIDSVENHLRTTP